MMRRAGAVAVLAVMVGSSVACLVLPPLWLVPVVAVAWVAGRRRAAYAWVVGLGIAVQVATYALLLRGGPAAWLGPVRLDLEGARVGLAAGLRLGAILGANLVLVQRFPPAIVADGLALPAAATARVAAVLLAAQGVGEDARHLRDGARMLGRWPTSAWRRTAAWAALLAPLFAMAVRRAHERRDALAVAGIRTSAGFVPTVAVAALAVAGRLPFVGLPNVALSYAVVFCAGMLWGWRPAALGGMLAMAVTDVVLSGLLPTALVNVPAMALLGVLGAAMRPAWFAAGGGRDAAGRVLAACAGALCMFAFSVAADSLEWLLVPELRATPGAYAARVVAGLAFNVLPAAANAALFAVSVPAVARAAGALGAPQAPRAPPRPSPPQTTPPPT